MRKIAFLLMILFLGNANAQEPYKFWVKFADKNGTPYSIQTPSSFLSPRALERRRQQGIAIDSLDLPVNPEYLSTIRTLGFGIRNVSKWINGAVVDATDTHMVASLRQLSFVESVALYELPTEYVREPATYTTTPSVPETHYRPFSKEYYNCSYRQIEQMNGMELHRAGYQGQGVLIGVCDAGFPGTDTIDLFNTMREEGRLIATKDFVWPGNGVYSDNAHGTMVLSTMAAYQPGFFVGTAPKASYVLCRTENPFSETPLEEYYWVSAVEYLDSLGADIVTTSLGYFEYDDDSQTLTMADLDGRTRDISKGAEVAFSKGILLVVSAGNNGADLPPHLNVPADAEHVLTVGAVNYKRNKASFSSPGPTADGRIKPDVMALGASVGVGIPTGGITISNGTSFSCPEMAGMMACVMQRYRAHTPGQLCDSVRSWGDNASDPDANYGYGIPDFSKALLSEPDYVGVVETQERQSVLLCPNPSKDHVRLCAEDPFARVYVYDMMGNRCCEGMVGPKTDAMLSSLTRGCYVVRVVSADGNKILKLVRE